MVTIPKPFLSKAFCFIVLLTGLNSSSFAQIELVKDIVYGSDGVNPEQFFSRGDSLYFFAIYSGPVEDERLLYRTLGTKETTVQILTDEPFGVKFEGVRYFEHADLLLIKYLDSIYHLATWNFTTKEFKTIYSHYHFEVDLVDTSIVIRELHPGYYRLLNLNYLTSDTQTLASHIGLKSFHIEPNRLIYQKAESSGYELWETDGSLANNSLLHDFTSGDTGVEVTLFVPVGFGDYLLQVNTKGNFDTYKYSGSTDSCFYYYYRSFEFDAVRLDDYYYYISYDEPHGYELWRGPISGYHSELFADLQPGELSSNVQDLILIDSQIFFAGAYIGLGREWWVSDGTPEGTQVIKNLNKGPSENGVVNSHYYITDNYILFNGQERGGGVQLYVVDPVSHDIYMVDDFNTDKTGHHSYSGKHFYEHNGYLYFAYRTPEFGNELCRLKLPLKIALNIDEDLAYPAIPEVYPNPGNGIFNLVDLNDHTYLEVWTITGERILDYHFEQSSQKIELDLRPYTNGVYFVRFSNKEGLTSTVKVVKIH